MKRIQPVSIWTPKGIVSCNVIDIKSLYDDLESELEVHYRLGYSVVDKEDIEEKDFQSVVEGNDYIKGKEYEALGTEGRDVNEDIKRVIIEKINLTLA